MANIVIQDRDLAILMEISQSTACSRTHLATRFFDGSVAAAKKRLHLLKRAGFICNNDTSSLGRTILRLTTKGARAVKISGRAAEHSTRRISQHMLRHEILLSECLASIRQVADTHAWFAEITTEEHEITVPIDCAGHDCLEHVTPDAFVVIHRNQPEHFFVEVDRGTETQEHLVHLGTQYRSYHRSGRFRGSHLSNDNERNRIRVLFLMTSRERLRRTANLLCRFARIRTLIWLCHVDDFKKDPINASWRCPIDFENLPSDAPDRSLF